MTLASPASSGSGSPSWSDRLAVQVQQLSEVAERLTYRLLELEERLALQEQQLAALQQRTALQGLAPPPIERGWSQTKARLARMGAALQGAPAVGAQEEEQSLADGFLADDFLADAGSATDVCASATDMDIEIAGVSASDGEGEREHDSDASADRSGPIDPLTPSSEEQGAADVSASPAVSERSPSDLETSAAVTPQGLEAAFEALAEEWPLQAAG